LVVNVLQQVEQLEYSVVVQVELVELEAVVILT